MRPKAKRHCSLPLDLETYTYLKRRAKELGWRSTSKFTRYYLSLVIKDLLKVKTHPADPE